MYEPELITPCVVNLAELGLCYLGFSPLDSRPETGVASDDGGFYSYRKDDSTLALREVP